MDISRCYIGAVVVGVEVCANRWQNQVNRPLARLLWREGGGTRRITTYWVNVDAGVYYNWIAEESALVIEDDANIELYISAFV